MASEFIPRQLLPPRSPVIITKRTKRTRSDGAGQTNNKPHYHPQQQQHHHQQYQRRGRSFSHHKSSSSSSSIIRSMTPPPSSPRCRSRDCSPREQRELDEYDEMSSSSSSSRLYIWNKTPGRRRLTSETDVQVQPSFDDEDEEEEAGDEDVELHDVSCCFSSSASCCESPSSLNAAHDDDDDPPVVVRRVVHSVDNDDDAAAAAVEAAASSDCWNLCSMHQSLTLSDTSAASTTIEPEQQQASPQNNAAAPVAITTMSGRVVNPLDRRLAHIQPVDRTDDPDLPSPGCSNSSSNSSNLRITVDHHDDDHDYENSLVETSASSSEETLVEQAMHVQEDYCRYQQCLQEASLFESQYRMEQALYVYQRYLHVALEHERLHHVRRDHAANEAYIRYRMGVVLWKLSRYTEALQQLEVAKTLYEKGAVLDDSNCRSDVLVETFLAMSNVLTSMASWRKAKEYLIKALRVLEVDNVLSSSSSSSSSSDDDDESDAEHQEEEEEEDDHSKVLYARVLHALGVLLVQRGQHDTAHHTLDEALRVQREKLGESHADVALTLQTFGSLHEATRRYEDAADCYLQAIDIYQWQSQSQPPAAVSTSTTGTATTVRTTVVVDLGCAIAKVGWLHYLNQDYDLALECYNETLERIVPILGPHHRNVAAVQVQMGMALAEQESLTSSSSFSHNLSMALDFYKEALVGQRQSLGDDHPDVATTLTLVGSVYARMDGKLHKAIEFVEHAVSIQRFVWGNVHTNVATTLQQLGHLLVRVGDVQHAQECFQEALETFQSAPHINIGPGAARACEPYDDARIVQLQQWTLHLQQQHQERQRPQAIRA